MGGTLRHSLLLRTQGGQTYNESPSFIAVFVPSVVDAFGEVFSESPAVVFLLLSSVADAQTHTFSESPITTFIVVPSTQDNRASSEILSLVVQFGVVIPNFVPIPEIVSAQWNEQGQVMFGDDESSVAWGWGAKIIESITYPPIRKRELVGSRSEVKD